MATSRLLAERLSDPALNFERHELAGGLHIEAGYLGDGYGRATPSGIAAMAALREHVGFALDTTYSAKAAAALLDLLPRARGPMLFWATKSSAALPPFDAVALAAAPLSLRRWIAGAERELADAGDLPGAYRLLEAAARDG